jgi:hypothetical protein
MERQMAFSEQLKFAVKRRAAIRGAGAGASGLCPRLARSLGARREAQWRPAPYRLARARGKPMTRIVAEALDAYLASQGVTVTEQAVRLEDATDFAEEGVRVFAKGSRTWVSDPEDCSSQNVTTLSESRTIS